MTAFYGYYMCASLFVYLHSTGTDKPDDWMARDLTALLPGDIALLSVCVFALSLSTSVFGPTLQLLDPKASPEPHVSWTSRLFFSYFDPMIEAGFEKPLEPEDLWDLNKADQAETVRARFHASAERNAARELQSPGCSVVRNLFCQEWTEIVGQAGWVLIEICFQFGEPVFLNRLLSHIQNQTQPTVPFVALLDVFGLFFAMLLRSICSGQNYFRGRRIGIRFRATTICAVYEKALRVDTRAPGSAGAGELTNLISVDAQRLLNFCSYMNMVWAYPLEIVLATTLLICFLGWSALPGLAVMALMLPLNIYVTGKIADCQSRLMTASDVRVGIVNEAMQGIRVIKFFAWELRFLGRISNARASELAHLRRYAYFSALSNILWFGIPLVVTVVSFVSYTRFAGHELTPSVAFTALALFNMLRHPLIAMPDIINRLIEAKVAIGRISAFLRTDEVDRPVSAPRSASAISIVDGSFEWRSEAPCSGANGEVTTARFLLDSINVTVPWGQLTTLVGSTGAGKSSLLLAMLGEMRRLSGRVTHGGSIAYVSQQPWIQNATVRDNILFGRPYDEARYRDVIYYCCLAKDLEQLQGGDLTEIGEKGINLSGGQKQRISLARAVYSDADIYLMDDPLSAVDAHVAQHLFHLCFRGALRFKTRVLVSHHVGLVLPESDQVIFIKEGRVAEQGKLSALLSQADSETALLFRTLGSSMSDDVVEPSYQCQPGNSYDDSVRALEQSRASAKLVPMESRCFGRITLPVYYEYIKAVGGLAVVLPLFVVFLIAQSSSTLQDIWLKIWTDAYANANVPVSLGYYLGIYAVISGANLLVIVLRALGTSLASIRGSISLHDRLMSSIFHARQRFFDTTPLGRIINRCSKDIETIDQSLAQTIGDFLTRTVEMGFIVGVIVTAAPLFCVALIPIVLLNVYLSRRYVRTSTELKRLDSISKSPIYSLFSETLRCVSFLSYCLDRG